ncbi:MAG TPA: DUF952 domain-containing protein [Anaerolineaceae bacterium]|jgi:uncharacterized protein (DUF952 family)
MIDLLHITRKEDWLKALADGCYRADSLASQGFIHCSSPAQVVATANRYYHGQHGLVLLGIDSNLVQAEVRMENLEGGKDIFPHIYGPLNLEGVVKVSEFEPDRDGNFGAVKIGE